MRNGKEYRQSIQQQIEHLLDKAHLGNEQRIIFKQLNSGKNEQFPFFYRTDSSLMKIETLSPDILDAYDAEYERIHQLYEKRKPVLDAYEKWLTFWNDFVAFTVNSNDGIRSIDFYVLIVLESVDRSWSFPHSWIQCRSRRT